MNTTNSNPKVVIRLVDVNVNPIGSESIIYLYRCKGCATLATRFADDESLWVRLSMSYLKNYKRRK